MRLTHKVKLIIKPPEPEKSIVVDVSAIKKYKFEINLKQIGVIDQKDEPSTCNMMRS